MTSRIDKQGIRDLIHDANNRLTTILTQLEVARGNEDAQATDECIDSAVRAARALSGNLKNLRAAILADRPFVRGSS